MLNWHQARRGQGVPTVSVLVGPLGISVRAWRAWAGARGSPVVQVDSPVPAALAGAWLKGALAANELLQAACTWLAGVLEQPPDALNTLARRMTRYDLNVLWKSLTVDAATPTARVAWYALVRQVAGEPTEPEGLLREFEGDEVTVIRGATGLLPESGWPAPILLAPTADHPDVWLERVARVLESIANAVPRLPVAIAATEQEYEGIERGQSGTRLGAMLREGVVRLRGVSSADLLDRLRAAGVSPDPPPQTVSRLTAEGLTEEAATAFIETALAVQSSQPEDAEGKARSTAEAFLKEQLDAMPETAGLFRLNQTLDFKHGPRAAEADLYAATLRLVIEIDGGYYHLKPEKYRSDRRKDLAYQRHNCLVLRFLAEDVVEQLDVILDTILDAVAWRQASAPGDAP